MSTQQTDAQQADETTARHVAALWRLPPGWSRAAYVVAVRKASGDGAAKAVLAEFDRQVRERVKPL